MFLSETTLRVVSRRARAHLCLVPCVRERGRDRGRKPQLYNLLLIANQWNLQLSIQLLLYWRDAVMFYSNAWRLLSLDHQGHTNTIHTYLIGLQQIFGATDWLCLWRSDLVRALNNTQKPAPSQRQILISTQETDLYSARKGFKITQEIGDKLFLMISLA